MKFLNLTVFIKAILSGVYIAIAAAVYLVATINIPGLAGTIVGGVLFCIGLLTIVAKDYYLYTGKVGYLLPYTKEKGINVVATTLVGNAIGIITMGILFNIAKIPGLNQSAVNAANLKFSKAWYVSLVLAFFCGIMMYTAVDGYFKIKDGLAKVLIVFLSVVVFLVLSFEHSIANILYLTVAFPTRGLSFKDLGMLVIMIIGNGLGGVFMNLLHTSLEKVNNK